MMKDQIKIFSVDTHAFYSKREKVKYRKLSKLYDAKRSMLEWLKISYIVDEVDKDFIFTDTYEKYKTKRDAYVDSKNKKESEHYEYFKAIAHTVIVSFKKQSENKMTEENWMKINKNEVIFKSKEFKEYCNKNEDYVELIAKIKYSNRRLQRLVNKNMKVRTLNRDAMYGVDEDGKEFTKINRQISLFTSLFTDMLGLETGKLCKDIIVVKTKDAKIMEQLVKNNFEFDQKTFIFMGSSAGQIRIKKGVFINKEVFMKHADTIMCGLSKELINMEEGVNPNKYLAYLSLVNSSCDIWQDFDITKAIVVKDFEAEVVGEYDYINKDTMEIIPNASSEKGKIKIIHTDGCGMILKTDTNTKPFQFRAPWFKGLLVPVPYLDFCALKDVDNYKVVDIFGKTWDLKKDDIQYIFSKSQFKMHKFYSNDLDEHGNIVKFGWDKYKDNFKKYGCKAGKLNEAPDVFKNKSINYQMIQTLTHMEPIEIKRLTKYTKDKILNSYTDTKAMLSILGAIEDNPKMTAEQKCLKVYPELLKDYHFKSSLESAIASTKEDAKGGTFPINAKTTFIVPDTYTWMEYLIANRVPIGGLAANTVHCSLFDVKDNPKLACLRSPHLYREWAIRDNVKMNTKWYCTNALYVSSRDLLSLTLSNDWDGDESLIVADWNLISVATRNMMGVNPLYYEMQTAEPKLLDNDSIWDSIKSAWKYGNIGIFSNKLTKLWNNPKPDLDIAKIICFLNNSSIDAAKTNHMPKVKDKDIRTKINNIEELQLPYFFQYCKDYNGFQVAPRGNSTMDRICAEFEAIDIKQEGEDKGKEIKHKYDYGKDIGRFSYKTLLKNKDIKKSDVYKKYNEAVIEKYDFLNEKKNYYFKKMIKTEKHETEKDVSSSYVIYKYCFDELVKVSESISMNDLCDILISHVFTKGKARKKTLLFSLFGDMILANLENNIAKPLDEGKYIQCYDCGTRVLKKSNRQVRCPSCSTKVTAKRNKNRKKKISA